MSRTWVRYLWLGALAVCVLAEPAWCQSGTRRARIIPRESPGTRSPQTTQLTPTPDGPDVPNEAIVRARPALALEGYDPVRLLESSVLVRGVEGLASFYDGHVFRFESPASQARFEIQPERFAPVLAGQSVVALVDRRAMVPGCIDYFAIEQGRLYLLASAEEREAFEARPAVYRDADLLMEGYSPVCLVDDEALRLGQPAEAIWFEGRRVPLVHRAERERFLAHPGRYWPVLGGIDPVSRVRGEPVWGSPRFAVLYKNRLYLFGNGRNRDEFLAHPDPFADLELADGGFCPVTFAETNVREVGHYGISTVHRGQRFLFATDAHRRRFLADPPRYDPQLRVLLAR